VRASADRHAVHVAVVVDDPLARRLPLHLHLRQCCRREISGKEALPRRPDGLPDLPPPGNNYAWHIENKLFVGWLESACRREGVRFTDAELAGTETGPQGIASIRLDDGSERTADFYIDSSGFASELIGKALGEPFEDFSGSLYCDRAVAGGWERTGEAVLPYTLSDTMDSGQ
jgi:tryptophan halogenase